MAYHSFCKVNIIIPKALTNVNELNLIMKCYPFTEAVRKLKPPKLSLFHILRNKLIVAPLWHRPCVWFWMWRHSVPCGGTWEPCVDMHHTAHYIAWSYREQERRGGTEALQMFSITGPQGRSAPSCNTCFCKNRHNWAKHKYSSAANDRKTAHFIAHANARATFLLS